MSLVMVIVTVALFVKSAWLVAVTCTDAGDGKSAGAVYTPAVVILPSVAVPPVVPFTLQVTAVFVVFCTVAVNINWFPSSTVVLETVTLTVICGGGGGGGELVVNAVQPSVHAPATDSPRKIILAAPRFFFFLRGRGRMPSA